MPKIYGSVRIDGSHLKCDFCGFEFESDEQLQKIISNRKASCPLCSAILGRDFRKPIDKDGNIFIDIVSCYKSIYKNVIAVKCKKCNNITVVKKDKFKIYLEKAICPNCSGLKISTEYTQNKEFDISEVKKDTKKQLKEDIRTSHKAKSFSVYVGKIYNKAFKIVNADASNVELACISCGFILDTRSPGRIKQKANNGTLFCPRCAKQYGEKDIIDKISSKYLGKVYNGLVIDNIYCEDIDGIQLTKCDAKCINSRKINGDKITYEHSYTNLDFGDLINGRITCDKCAKLRIIEGDFLVQKELADRCPTFTAELRRPRISLSKAQQLTIGDLYTQDKSLCDFCTNQECKLKGSPNFDFKNIMDSVEYKRKKNETIRNTMAEFPGICSYKKKNIYREINDKSLIKFRKAYNSRDDEAYYFCKCIDHGTEMILSNQEIEDFNHTECNEFKQSNIFLNIDELYLPIED